MKRNIDKSPPLSLGIPVNNFAEMMGVIDSANSDQPRQDIYDGVPVGEPMSPVPVPLNASVEVKHVPVDRRNSTDDGLVTVHTGNHNNTQERFTQLRTPEGFIQMRKAIDAVKPGQYYGNVVYGGKDDTGNQDLYPPPSHRKIDEVS